jgi:hypothetical protein
MKRNAPVLCTKRAMYYLYIAFDRHHLQGGLHLQFIVLDNSQNCKKLGAATLDL